MSLLKKKQKEEATRAVDMVASVYSGGDPPVIPFELVSKWCDNFSIANKLGDGSFSEVYQGVCRDSSKRYYQVAVKRLSSSILEQAMDLSDEEIHTELVNNLKREVNALSVFRHDNIIKLLGYSMADHTTTSSPVQDNTMCLVLELGTRGGLHNHLRDDENAKLLTWKRRVRILARVATALNYLHSHNKNPCFHRDIKSSNIVLTSDYQPKLIDCGLSKYISDDPTQRVNSVFQSPRGKRYGTSLYMDPSYLVDGDYSVKSEIYSFGIVIAEVLTGLLQGNNDAHETIYSIDTDVDELIPDTRLADNPFPVECAQVLQELVLQCLTSPKKRISSMVAVMRQLLDIEKRYCAYSEEEAQCIGMIHGMEEELQQLKLSGLKRMPSVEESVCLSCNIECVVDNGVKCSSNHFMCNDCFSSTVVNQLSSEYRASFVNHGSNIVCNFCLPTSNAFSKQQLACHLSDALFNQYNDVIVQVIEAKKAEAEAEVNLCVICLANPKTHCFVPCGHVCVCSSCCVNQRSFSGKCPVCRAQFTTIFRPFV